MLTTADAVTVIEEGILNELVERFFEYDYQFRSEPVSVRKYGELGIRAQMEVIEPIQFDERYAFRWYGVEAARSTQQVQQQIAALNIVRGIPPELYKGHVLDMTPAIENLMENAFGPRLAPKVFKDMESDMGINATLENDMLDSGFHVHIHATDNDQLHIQKHLQGMKHTSQDVMPAYQMHIQEHQAQMEMKEQIKFQQAMAQSQQGQPQQGVPGSPGAAGQPGLPGQPQPGSQPAVPSGMKAPPGTIPQDQMRDPSVMPRKM